MENEVCPLLGLVEDQGAYLTYPSYENRCYSSVVPQPVPLNEQTFFCLGGHKERCPRFQSRQALLKAQGVADDDVAEQAAAAPGASEAGEPAGDDVLAWDAPEDGDGEGDSFAWTSQPEEPGWSSEGYGLEPPQAPPLLPMTASGRARRPVWPLLLAAGTLVAVLMLCGLASAGWLGWRALSTQLAVQPTGTPVVEVGGGPPGSAATPTSGPGGVVIVVATPTPNPPEATATAEAAATATMLALATATPTATEFISFDTPIPQFPTATPTWTPFVVPTPRDTPTFFPTNTPFVPQATATWTWTPAPAQATATPSVEPFFASFVANPLNIQYGQTSTLTWTVRGVRAIYLDGEAVSGPTGSKSVQPLRTTTYVLRMIMPDNSVREETQTVTVTAPTPSATPSPTATPTATPFVNMTFAQDLSLTSINGQESSCRTGSGCTLFQVQVRNVGNRPAEYQLTKTETIPIGWGVFFCWGGDCEFGNTPPPRTLAAGARDTVSINFRVPSALEDGQTAVVNVNGSCPACAIPPFQPYSNTFTVRVILPTPTPPPTGTATHTPTITPTPTWTATPTWTPTTPPGN